MGNFEKVLEKLPKLTSIFLSLSDYILKFHQKPFNVCYRCNTSLILVHRITHIVTWIEQWYCLPGTNGEPSLKSRDSQENDKSRIRDDDEDACDDAVAVIKMLRYHSGVSDKKMSRSEQVKQKEVAFLNMK